MKYILADEKKCLGCRTCEIKCSFNKEGMVIPEKSMIRITIRENGGLWRGTPVVCIQCDPPPCAEECPTEAIFKDGELGIVLIDEENCNGCKSCLDACPYGAIIMDTNDEFAVKCDLCGGNEPLCIQECHYQALQIGQTD